MVANPVNPTEPGLYRNESSACGSGARSAAAVVPLVVQPDVVAVAASERGRPVEVTSPSGHSHGS